MQEVKNWVKGKKNTRTRETKYFRLVKTYWVVKALVAQGIEKSQKENNTNYLGNQDSVRETRLVLLILVWHKI